MFNFVCVQMLHLLVCNKAVCYAVFMIYGRIKHYGVIGNPALEDLQI